MLQRQVHGRRDLVDLLDEEFGIEKNSQVARKVYEVRGELARETS